MVVNSIATWWIITHGAVRFTYYSYGPTMIELSGPFRNSKEQGRLAFRIYLYNVLNTRWSGAYDWIDLQGRHSTRGTLRPTFKIIRHISSKGDVLNPLSLQKVNMVDRDTLHLTKPSHAMLRAHPSGTVLTCNLLLSMEFASASKLHFLWTRFTRVTKGPGHQQRRGHVLTMSIFKGTK